MNTFDAGAALCVPFLEQLPVAGVSISVVSSSGAQSTVGTSDLIALRLEELQLRLGEGPTPDALRTGRPVLVPDLDVEGVHRRWPLFASGAQDIGARALFSIAMSMSGVTVGVVSLYVLGRQPAWTETTLQTALRLARAVAPAAVEVAMQSAMAEPSHGRQQTELRREVHQAAGMVMAQLDCSVEEAIARLRARAFVEDRPIDIVARAVVARELDFAVLPD